jgi:hypothetical protein
MSLDSLAGLFSHKSGVHQSMGNTIMSAIVGFVPIHLQLECFYNIVRKKKVVLVASAYKYNSTLRGTILGSGPDTF